MYWVLPKHCISGFLVFRLNAYAKITVKIGFPSLKKTFGLFTHFFNMFSTPRSTRIFFLEILRKLDLCLPVYPPGIPGVILSIAFGTLKPYSQTPQSHTFTRSQNITEPQTWRCSEIPHITCFTPDGQAKFKPSGFCKSFSRHLRACSSTHLVKWTLLFQPCKVMNSNKCTKSRLKKMCNIPKSKYFHIARHILIYLNYFPHT